MEKMISSFGARSPCVLDTKVLLPTDAGIGFVYTLLLSTVHGEMQL